MTVKSHAKFEEKLVVWKMICGIWQIFTRTFGSVKIGIVMGPFCSK